MNASQWPRRAAVVGTGAMGTGFAQLLALAGIETVVCDASSEAAVAGRDRAIERATAAAARFAAGPEGDPSTASLWGPDAGTRVAANLSSAPSVAVGVAGVDLVLEAVTEDPAVKAAVYAEIEGSASEDCVVATNTSAIPIGQLSEAFRVPSRFLGAHWFFPAEWVPCVELIPGPATDPRWLDLMAGVLKRLGKAPSVVGDGPGFVANRIQFAMFKEAAAIVEDGVASAEVVDAVVRSSFGFRLPFFGPFTIADMAGLDVYAGAYAALEEGLGERMAVPPAVADLVGRGRLGVKAGGGFVDRDPADAARMTAWRDSAYHEMSTLLARLGAWDAPPPAEGDA